MGNFVNRESWVGQQQLRFVEETIWWNGTLSRSEIVDKFKCSPQQATAIIQSYLELNPKAMKYSLKVRRYLANPRMKCIYTPPSFADEILSDEERLGGLMYPLKKIEPKVPRNLIVAIRQNKSVKITYQSNRNQEEAETRGMTEYGILYGRGVNPALIFKTSFSLKSLLLIGQIKM